MVPRILDLALVLKGLLLSSTLQTLAQPDHLEIGKLKYEQVTIAFRTDAAPFSSLVSDAGGRTRDSSARTYNQYDFEGYAVTICRRALRELLSSAPVFRNAKVIVKTFSADDIKSGDAELPEDGIDIYCGPTSITQERLYNYYVSMPIYLTGTAVASHPTLSSVYPSSGSYCDPIVGLVRNTTAFEPGLRKASNYKKFQRFNQIVSELVRDKLDPRAEKIEYSLAELRNKIDMKNYCEGVLDHVEDGESDAGSKGKIPRSVQPVVLYDNHQEGLSDFCRGRFLYYVADIDIISDYLSKNKEACDIDLRRDVLFKEHYGIYFAKSAFGEPDYLRSILIYSYFNLALTKLNREGDGVFMEAYRATFQNRARTQELENFFRSTSYGIR